jgi:RHS repeat-associated protein
MGERIYMPIIGRFLQMDPIEGGVENNYVYPPDPVNDFDLNGQKHNEEDRPLLRISATR